MVMKIGIEVDETLIITLTYDDCTSKTEALSVGDYISIDYNKNGARRRTTGFVNTIHADPSNAIPRRDQYIIVMSDNPSDMNPAIKISLNNILDVVVIRKHEPTVPISTTEGPMRITHLRYNAGYLQFSTNNGKSWYTIPLEVKEMQVGEAKTIEEKVEAMIGDDQYADSDEFVDGIVRIIQEEVAKKIAPFQPNNRPPHPPKFGPDSFPTPHHDESND